MRIWKNDDTSVICAIADKGKVFKTDEGYFNNVHIASEEDALSLEEVYYHNGMEVTEEQHNRFALLHELKEIREWFESTDYIPNKVIVGEWEATDPRFVEYCEKRKQMRERQDVVKEFLYGGIV